MGVYKIRQKAVLKDGMTVTGSAGFSGTIQVNTAIAITGPISAPTGSAAAQKFGYLRINSGQTSATMSTTALNSGALVILGCGVLVGASVASYNLVGELVVNTIAQAASGGYFTAGFAATGNAYAAPLDVPWFIINPA